MKPTPKTAAPAILTIAALALAACAPEDGEGNFAGFEDGVEASEETSAPQEAEGTEDEATAASGEGQGAGQPEEEEPDVIYAEIDDPRTFEECEAAEELGDATVTWLDDVVLPEERHEGVDAETIEFDAEEVEIPGAPEIVIPERVAQAGCIIEYHAPANCAAQMEISPAYIPGYEIPGRSLPEYELPDGTVLPEVTQDGVSAEAVDIEGEVAEETCQIEPEDAQAGDRVNHERRGHIRRNHIRQNHERMNHERRGHERIDGDVVPSMVIPSIVAPSVVVPSVVLPSEVLESYYLTEGTERSGEDTVSYTTEGDVLFDTGEYELRSDAESELQAIADDIAVLQDQDFDIEVEGHTDNEPVTSTDRSFSDNYELSELRAESVQDWLVDNADVDAQEISSVGMGEDYPRADNDTEEGRELNRRVVITVIPEGAEDAEIEYELEDEG